jgi:hypothetical protein
MIVRKHENQGVRTHPPAGQIPHVLLRPHESCFKPASHQRLGERRGVIARQADVDAAKFVAQDAPHLGQQTDFAPRQKAEGERRLRQVS